MQFLNININTTVELPAHLYIILCLKITAKINKHLIQIFLNAESEINMMNHKIAEIYDISICCEVTFEMKTVDLRKTFFYNYTENVEVNITDITFILFIFITKGIENELIFKCL